jgi:hypothetical protein
MPELAIPDVRWNPGTIAFIFDQRVPYCLREPHFHRDIDRMTKKITKGAHEWTKEPRDGECLWKQSNIGEGLGEQCNKGEYSICTLRFDFLNEIWCQKTPLGIVLDFSNKNLVSKNGILALPFVG